MSYFSTAFLIVDLSSCAFRKRRKVTKLKDEIGLRFVRCKKSLD